MNIDLKISQERLEELQKTHKITKVSPTQAKDIQAILYDDYVEYFIQGGRDGGKTVVLQLVLVRILSGDLGNWKANILLMRNTKEAAKKTIVEGMLQAVLNYMGRDYEDFKRASKDRGYYELDGHKITVASFDADVNNSERLKGYSNVTHVFIEEFKEITNWSMYQQLYQTIRQAIVTWEENGVRKFKKMEGKIITAFNTPEFGSPILNQFYDLVPTEYDGFFKPEPKTGLVYDKDYNTGELIPNENGVTYEEMKRYYSFSTVYDNTVLRESQIQEGENSAIKKLINENANLETAESKKIIKEAGERAWKLYLYRKHEMYKTTDPYYFLTQSLGLVGSGRSGKVFNGWQEITEEEYKKVEATEFYGIDWGFSGQGDPSALTAVKHIPAENVGELPSIYINNLLYEKGLTLPKLVEKIMQSVPNFANAEFYIDHMPAAQSELVDKGFNRNYVILADKGADSRAISASYIAGNFKIYYVKNKTLDKELENYQWVIDRQGNPTGKPSDGGDHIIDSIRYPIYTKLHPKKNETSKFWDDFYADYLLTDGEKTSTF
jgi:hypothetical protein